MGPSGYSGSGVKLWIPSSRGTAEGGPSFPQQPALSSDSSCLAVPTQSLPSPEHFQLSCVHRPVGLLHPGVHHHLHPPALLPLPIPLPPHDSREGLPHVASCFTHGRAPWAPRVALFCNSLNPSSPSLRPLLQASGFRGCLEHLKH